MTEVEKNRIRELHKEFSVIQEQKVELDEWSWCWLPWNYGKEKCRYNRKWKRENRGMDESISPVGRISERNLKILIRRAINEKTTKREMVEVYSEKQRRWACVQANLPSNKRQKSLSKKEADEMCGDVNISKKK